MKEIKTIVAENLTKLRIKKNYTQAEVAKAVNYTDKSVSKWENGDALPPIDTLKELSDFYGVTLDYLVTDEPKESFDKIFTAKENIPNKIIITALAVSIVWLIATILFVYSPFIGFERPWLLFILAVPFSTVVLYVYNAMWGKRIFSFILSSAFTWSFIATLYLFFIQYTPWTIFLIGAPVQVSLFLWYQLKRTRK